MKPKRTTFIAGLALAGLLSASCLGPSPTTGRLFKWNNELDGKWGNEVAFVLLLPVYVVASVVGDLLICNSWYWWTGEYLIDPPQAERPVEFGI